MSDQPTPTPPSTQSLDDILNQLEKTTGSVTPTTTPPVPTTPVPTPPEPTVSGQEQSAPAPIVDTPTSNPASIPDPATETPAEVPPVATLPENDIPTPPPAPVTEPAPMVKEEPAIDTTKSLPPEPGTTTVPVPETPITPVPQKASSPMGKIVLGIVGVLMLAGVAGIGVYATRMQQNTQGTAYVPPTPVTQQTPDSTEVPVVTASDKLSNSVTISGKACTNSTSGPGNVFFTDSAKKTTVRYFLETIDSAYTVKLPPGTYVIHYKTSDGKKVTGYTDSTHQLKPITASIDSVHEADVCDELVDSKSIPALGTVTSE